MKHIRCTVVPAFVLLFLVQSASAHHVMDSGVGALQAGIDHAVQGLDHTLFLIAAALFCAAASIRHTLRPLLSILGGLVGGIALGSLGLAVPAAEVFAVLSVLLVAVAVALNWTAKPATLVAVIAFAAIHGTLLGNELRADVPNAQMGWLFAIGFVFAALCAQAIAAGAAIALRHFKQPALVRAAGIAIILLSAFLLVPGLFKS